MALTDQDVALDVRYPAHSSQVALIRQAVGDVASDFGAGDDVLLQINLAVSEAATNAVQHAYRDRPADAAGDLRVVVRPGFDGLLAVHVQDFGVGLTPRTDSPGMGLGLCLMAHETECLEVRKAPTGGTEVILHFRICSAGARQTARSTSSHAASWKSHSSARRRSSTTPGAMW